MKCIKHKKEYKFWKHLLKQLIEISPSKTNTLKMSFKVKFMPGVA